MPNLEIIYGRFLSHKVSMPLAEPPPGGSRFATVIKTAEMGSVFADDGVRFWIDDDLALEAWRDPQRQAFTVDRTLSTGYQRLLVEQYDALGWATL